MSFFFGRIVQTDLLFVLLFAIYCSMIRFQYLSEMKNTRKERELPGAGTMDDTDTSPVNQ